jgi:hypothetical protein
MADMFQPHGLPAAQLPTAPPAQFAPPAVVALNRQIYTDSYLNFCIRVDNKFLPLIDIVKN